MPNIPVGDIEYAEEEKTPQDEVEANFQEFTKWEKASEVVLSQWENSLDSTDIPLGEITSNPSSEVLATFQSPNAINPITGILEWVSSYKCPGCGKKLEIITPTGYCSVECMAADLLDKILSGNHPGRDLQDKILKDTQICLQTIDLITNLVSSIPRFLTIMTSMPNLYANYMLVKINYLFLKIQVGINEIMIKINDAMISYLNFMKNGIYDLNSALASAVQAMVQALNVVVNVFNQAYGAAYKIISSIMAFFQIPEEGMAFNFTPRSISYNPTNFAVNIPLTCSIEQSCLNFIKVDTIVDMVKVVFPPITAPELLMEPALFEARLILSDQNYKAILAAVEPLLRIMVNGAEPLPKYEKLSLTNIFFLLYLLTSWGPTSRSTFGFPMPAP